MEKIIQYTQTDKFIKYHNEIQHIHKKNIVSFCITFNRIIIRILLSLLKEDNHKHRINIINLIHAIVLNVEPIEKKILDYDHSINLAKLYDDLNDIIINDHKHYAFCVIIILFYNFGTMCNNILCNNMYYFDYCDKLIKITEYELINYIHAINTANELFLEIFIV